ncbi:DUF2846 domain-containing protein [uncultured Desulfovibrio sp.]|uniref:DUF2846 domain-containing protein n=1 Tax=uncultured Desulfovibrio sp. TaxID=167968 RepID=UPI0026134E3C|nr:DUF2846 domain-containing protein [uncultured Desulfovibrio sp.]
MRKNFTNIALALLFISIVGCAKMPLRGDYVEEKSPPQIQTDEQSAAIVFFREWAFTGGGMSYFITEDTNNIGLLKAGSYFAYRATPGKHTYSAETEARSSVTLDVQPGQTYYIEGGIGMGFWAGRPQLSEVTKPIFDKVKTDLKYIRLATPEEAAQFKEKEQKRDAGTAL